MKFGFGVALALSASTLGTLSAAAPAPRRAVDAVDAVCADCVATTMRKLAGDEFRGRGCATSDEAAAATFIEGELRRLKVDPAFPGGAYRQRVELRTPAWGAAPTLTVGDTSLTHGDGVAFTGGPERLDAALVRITDPASPGEVSGKVVLYDVSKPERSAISGFLKAHAAGVIVPASPQTLARWADIVAQPPGETEVVGAGTPSGRGPLVVYAKPEAVAALRAQAGAQVRITAPAGAPQARVTQNVVGVVHGSAPDADRQAILLTAHYDHLGVRGGQIFHGADDDASGVAAVLEFARIFGAGPKPRRTVYFALFGCEEEGGLGAQLFQAQPPTPIQNLAANLEFEMIGVDDPKSPGRLMLTGWERSNLGPTLAEHGARIGPDPYPDEHFFQRSDNYQLALKGVVAQTVSAWPLTPTYHQASDDLAHVDLAFMSKVIGSLVEPIRWLADSDFRPAWNPGQKP